MQRPFACHLAFEIAFWAIAASSCALLSCGGKALIDRPSGGAAPPDAGSVSTSCGDTQSDNRNCGACGVPCTGTCNTGRCTVTLAAMQANVDCIAVDAKSIFWINAGFALDEGSGELRRAALGGGAFTTLSTAPGMDIGWPCRMKVDHSSVYWTTGNLGGPVFQIPISGAAPSLIAPTELGATALVLDGTDLYWTGPYAGVRKAPLAGSPVTTLSMRGGSDIAIDAAHVYWTFNDEPNTDSKIISLPLDGGTPTDLVTGLNDPMALAADASGVYWVDYGTGTVARAAQDGTVTTLATMQAGSQVIALDDSNVYWGTAFGEVRKVSKAGGAPTELAFSANVLDLAVDGSSVYWTDGSQVLKVTPK